MKIIELVRAKLSSALDLINSAGIKSIPYIFYYSFKRWGLSYLFTPIFSLLRSDMRFMYKSKRLKYFYHNYNMTWNNSRAIEIPIAMFYLKDVESDKVLEIGNVMKHYGDYGHDVVDKYERADGVNNQDVENITSNKKYDLILSISTMEHVGQDEKPCEPKKSVRSIRRLKKLLSPKGKLVVTLPFSHNHALDEERKKLFNDITYYQNIKYDWNIINEKTLLASDTEPKFGVPYKFVYVGVFENGN